MEKGRGKRIDTLQTDNGFTRKEYIEREAALELIDGIYDCNDMVFEKNDSCVGLDCGSCRWRDTKNYIRGILARIPAADVVPVVRCGECRYWHRCLSDDGSVEYFNFSHCKKGHNGFPTFFCADGARKDGDGERAY